MDKQIIVGLVLLATVALLVVIFLAWPRRNGESNLKRIKVNFLGIGSMMAEGQERKKKGDAIIEDTKARNASAVNLNGGDASVKRVDANGNVSAFVSDGKSPN